jgi:hypothetical protein
MRKNIGQKFAVFMLAILLSVMLALPAMAAETWKQINTRFSAIAGETLVTGDVVCIVGATGYAWKADADDAALRPAVGVIGKGGTAGHVVEIVVVGTLAGQTAASPGVRLYLSAATAGAITATAPTNAQALGWVLPGAAAAATSTTYFINVNAPSSAGAAY